jgi:predicted amidophosphoribosyltransferase
MLGDLIHRHGWHVLGELAFLALVTVFTVFYVVALVRGRVRAVRCPSCERLASRAHERCPRCGAALDDTGMLESRT